MEAFSNERILKAGPGGEEPKADALSCTPVLVL